MNIVCVGAHPDDAEVFAGATCLKWARLGHQVLMVSLTNGDAGHFSLSGGALAKRREAEAHASARRAGVQSLVLDNHDGELAPTLELRKRVVTILREFQADIVLSHRPYDYHPDHRYTSIVVQDAAFMVTVPNFCPHVPALSNNPVFVYMMDRFTRPVPIRPDIAVAIDDVMEAKWNLLDAMESQFYEWLPWLDGKLDQVPQDPLQRPKWLGAQWKFMFEAAAISGRAALNARYGKAAANHVRNAELFEICEYGRQLSEDEIRQLFPFFPKPTKKKPLNPKSKCARKH